MLVNTNRKKDRFKEGDINVEHLNNDIKAHAHGSNASPQLLEKITPAIGQAKELISAYFKELMVKDINQHHSHVIQDSDIGIIVKYLTSAEVFQFTKDTPSEHIVTDLF
ncbi:hypothetical protein ABKN59_010551 [Abortiporus biennis]